MFNSSSADIDGDGDVDVMMCGVDSDAVLMWNDGTGRFEVEIRPDWNVDQAEFGCGGVGTWADYDRDGDLDLFYGRLGGRERDGQSTFACRSTLVINDGTGGLDAIPELVRDAAGEMKIITAAWEDFDRDGWLDLYVVADHPYTRARLLRNRGDGSLTNHDAPGLAVAAHAMGIGLGDMNRDGYPDVVVPDISRNLLLMSRGSDFAWSDASRARRLMPDPGRGQSLGWGGETGDLDNDGTLDVLITYSPAASADRGTNAREQPDEVYLGHDDVFEPVGAAWGVDELAVTRGVLAVDLNRDGWLDIVKRELGGVVFVQRARCGERAWLEVSLHDETSANHAGVGAQVTVHVGDVVQRRTVHAGGRSYAVSAPPVVHFGLGDIARVDLLEVRWPDGETRSYGSHAARQILTVFRRDAP